MKRVTVGEGEVYIFPTLKGLVSEGPQVGEAFRLIGPDVVCVSLSDRELAEVRFAIADDGGEPEEDYVPESESMRRALGMEGEEGGEEGGGEGGVKGGGERPEGAGDGTPDELEMPAGVVSREMVEEAMDEPFHPDLVTADGAARSDQVFISDTDMAYSRKLATFGDVELPPPAFVEAVRLAEGHGVPVEDVDLSDDEYTQVFVDHVSYWQLVGHSRKVRGMSKRLRADSPEEMARAWDDRLRKARGFAVVERERERKMAAELLRLLGRHGKVLAVIDMVRVEGVVEELRRRASD